MYFDGGRCVVRERPCLEKDKISVAGKRFTGENSDAELHKGMEALLFMSPRDAAVVKRGYK